MNTNLFKSVLQEELMHNLFEDEYKILNEIFSNYEDDVFCEQENTRLKHLYEKDGESKFVDGEFIINEPNSKLTNIPSFNIPAGHTCPGADTCLARIINKKDDPTKRQMKIGNNAVVKCFAANLELQYETVFKTVRHNFNVLKQCNSPAEVAKKLVSAIEKSPFVTDKFRIHVHGDFFSKDYLRAWIAVAKYFPRIQFYAYTKSLNFLPKDADKLPSNFKITLSMGGKFDKRADELDGYIKAYIVKTKEEADELGLEIDYDDSLANSGNKSFALLIHGTQIGGTENGRLVKLYNDITRELKGLGVSAKDVKRVLAKMRVKDIITKFFPSKASVWFARIYNSKLDNLFDGLPPENSLPNKKDLKQIKQTSGKSIDSEQLRNILNKLPKTVVNQLQANSTSNDDLVTQLQSYLKDIDYI